MSGNQFQFSEIDSRDSFSNLGQSLGSKAINNVIQINGETGQGSIKKIDFEKGLHLRAWNFSLFQPFTLHRKAEKNIEVGKAFTLVYILSTDAIVLKSPAFRKDIHLRDNMNILLLSNNMEIDFDIEPSHSVKAIDITISAEWMKAQFSDADPLFQNFVEKMKDSSKPAFYIEPGTSMEYRTAIDLHTHVFTPTKGTLYLKAKTLSLISDFLNRSFTHYPNELIEGNVLHQDKMLIVEKILEDHFEKNLPAIELIAKQVTLSESTLKRHFKLMFGKSIYECYLEKKMDYAKRLLLEKPLTVKEVAYRLGYEKTSNFIHIFKKFHSYSPGHLKKNIAF